MSNLADTELSRVLHDIVPTPPVDVTRMDSIRMRVRRAQRRRRTIAVACVAVAVGAVAVVPSGLLGSRRDATTSVASFLDGPARGDLSGDPSILGTATRAWQDALVTAKRSRLVTRLKLVYAGHVQNQTVVVIAGTTAWAGDRLIVLTGPDAQHLTVYSDNHSEDAPSYRVLFGDPPQTDLTQREYTACGHKPSTNTVSRPLLVLTSSDTATARWKSTHAFVSDCKDGTHQIDSPWTSFAVHDGVGVTEVRYTAEEELDLDTPGRRGGGDVDFPSPTEPLPGTRVDAGAPVRALAEPQVTESQSSDGTGTSTVSVGGSIIVPGGDGKDAVAPDPLGWRLRYDASPALDGFQTVSADADGASAGTQPLALAAPDGSRVAVVVIRAGTGQRVAVVSDVDGRRQIQREQPLDSSNLPKQLCAVYTGRDGVRWLFVAGAPGTYDIAYRAPGEKTWVSSEDVYMSSAFIRLDAGDSGRGQLRLMRHDGTVVWEGPVTQG